MGSIFRLFLLIYEHIHFNNFISISAYKNDNSFQDSFTFCEFNLNDTLEKKYSDTYFQLIKKYNQRYKISNIKLVLKFAKKLLD